MKTIFTFLLESSAAMALFYAVYWFCLRKETFFRINRIYLIGALLLSVLLPVFPVTYTVWRDASAIGQGNARISLVTLAGSSSSSGLFHEKMMLLLTGVYLGGALLVLLRLIFQTLAITRTIGHSEIIKNENITLVKNNRYDLPFSFFHLVFYNPGVHLQEDLPGILAHEKVHIREQHWMDLVIAELWSVFYWFNPFVWLYERAIRQNHEFLADAGVLAQGHPVGRYKALLINQLMGVPVAGITNHLSFTFSATRFKMMTQKTENKKRVFRLVWAIPVLALLLVAFAQPDYKSRTSSADQGPGNSQVSQKIPAVKITGAVVKPDGTPLDGTSIILAGTTTGTVSKADGTFELVIPANQPASLVFSYVGYVTKVQKIDPVDHDVTLKTNKMVEAVIPIDKETAISIPPPPPPPPPPPSTGSQKVQKDAEMKDNTGIEAKVPPPPPPPPPSATGTNKGNKVVEESAGGGKEPFIMVEQMPEYPGGQEALRQYVDDMTVKTARERNLKGNATVLFSVNEEGKVTDIVVKNQDNDEVGKAAVEILSGLKRWKPGSQHAKNVSVRYAVVFKF